jgi:hypothetical protein
VKAVAQLIALERLSLHGSDTRAIHYFPPSRGMLQSLTWLKLGPAEDAELHALTGYINLRELHLCGAMINDNVHATMSMLICLSCQSDAWGAIL